jgi:predicted site-specific integrase-resolvase
MCLKPRGFMWVSTTKIAKIEGVTSQTIRRKVEAGFYKKVMKTSGGHYRIFLNHQRQVCYARVSSSKQRSSIDTQQRILLERYPDAEFIFDIASAFNFKRKGLQTILESAMLGSSIKIVVTTKDRLARSGFELIKWLVELSGGQIEILDDSDNTTESFDAAELIGFITSFCNSHYGKRSAKRRKNNNNKKD